MKDDDFESKISDGVEVMNEYQYFKLLFSDEIIDLLVEESNNYYQKVLLEKYGPDYRKIILSKTTFNTYPYLYVTKGITRDDILAFIGIRMYMGLHKYPNFEFYWNDSEIYKNVVGKIMSKTYFFLISKALHFPEKETDKDEKGKKEGKKEGKDEKEEKEETEEENDTTQEEIKPEDLRVDPRAKFKLYLEKLAQNFQKYYVLGKNITIDESIIQFKGRNNMKFYIPMKPHKWGFKIHLLCDSDTHYLYNMLFDPGKAGKDFINYEDNSSLAESVVLRLLTCIKDNKQRNLFCDGWYSSISLMKKLTKMGYLITTILRSNSKELPSKIKLEGYETAEHEGIYVQKYEGKKTILFATNYLVDKEELRNIYNIKNRGVDTFDQYLEISSIQRRTKKWYKKIFLFGIDASIINAKILCQLRTGRNYTTNRFKEKIVETIFKMYMDNMQRNGKNNNNSSTVDEKKKEKPGRNMDKTHNVGHVANNKRPCKRCGKKTPYICIECNIPLHPECFTEYHNKVNI